MSQAPFVNFVPSWWVFPTLEWNPELTRPGLGLVLLRNLTSEMAEMIDPRSVPTRIPRRDRSEERS